MIALTLVQPFSANDIILLVGTVFAGIIVIIRTLKTPVQPQTPADAKADTLGEQVSGLQDMVKTLTQSVTNVSLAVSPTSPKAGTTTTTTTVTPQPAAKPVNPALVDTVAGLPVIEAPVVVKK